MEGSRMYVHQGQQTPAKTMTTMSDSLSRLFDWILDFCLHSVFMGVNKTSESDISQFIHTILFENNSAASYNLL